jgi:hypothetical protein
MICMPLAFSGCGNRLAMVEVEGIVTLEGKPLDNVMVEYWPLGEGVRSFGTTDQTGKYVLMSDDGKRNGATLGQHKIVLHDTSIYGTKFLGRGGDSVDMTEGRKSRIAAKYESAQSTDLQKEVVAGKKNQLDITLTKK